MFAVYLFQCIFQGFIWALMYGLPLVICVLIISLIMKLYSYLFGLIIKGLGKLGRATADFIDNHFD